MSKERAAHYYSIMTGKMPDELKEFHLKKIVEVSTTMKVLKNGKIWDKKQQNKGLFISILIGVLIMCFPK